MSHGPGFQKQGLPYRASYEPNTHFEVNILIYYLNMLCMSFITIYPNMFFSPNDEVCVHGRELVRDNEVVVR